jgi:hypothetical protein
MSTWVWIVKRRFSTFALPRLPSNVTVVPSKLQLLVAVDVGPVAVDGEHGIATGAPAAAEADEGRARTLVVSDDGVGVVAEFSAACSALESVYGADTGWAVALIRQISAGRRSSWGPSE